MNQFIAFFISWILFTSLAIHAQDTNALYTYGQVRELHLEFEDEHWYNKLKHYKKEYSGKRVPADLEIDGERYEKVAVRFKGNSSFYSPLKTEEKKLPFNIDSDKFNDGQHYRGHYEKLKLSNIFYDPSYVREVLAYRIARDYLLAPEANFALLNIEGEDIGIYTNSESVDEKFLKKRLGYDEGTLMKCDPEWYQPYPKGCKRSDNASLEYLGQRPVCYKPYYESKSEKDKDWKYLIELCRTLDAADLTKLNEMINIDAVLWMHAFNVIMVNLDSYTGRFCHNYYLFRDSFGVFQPIMWDLNMAFGGFKFSKKGGPLSVEEMKNLSVFLHINSEQRPLIRNILNNKFYRYVYLDHVRTIKEEWLDSDKYLEEAKFLTESIQEYLPRDKHSLYDIENPEEYIHSGFEANGVRVVGLSELMEARTAYLNNHPVIGRENVIIDTVAYQLRADSLELELDITGKAKEIYFFHRSAPNAPYKKTKYPLEADKKIVLEASELREFYIVAMGEDSADVYPSKASKAPFRLGFNSVD